MNNGEMDFLAVEEKVKAGYAIATAGYRRDDEIEVTTENHRRLSRVLAELCLSFSTPITVLDVGCGTGRYFHCLKNVARLIGMDISEEMLLAARHPVREAQICARGIQLIRANAYLYDFPRESFHLIYSLGMFGNGCPLTVEICNRFYDWLLPGGKLFFNAVDFAGLPLHRRWGRRMRELAISMPLFEKRLRTHQGAAPFFCLTKRQLEERIASTQFRDYTVTSQPSNTPLWQGRHLECIAVKPRL